jgi:nucleotide-binding universal stress UspA family protein
MWHSPPRGIVVAVDFGDPSARALAVAGTLAMAWHASVIAVYAEIFEPPAYFTTEQLGTFQAQHREARKAAATHLLGFAARHTDAAVRTAIVELPPAEAILQVSQEQDLIVMGTHGRRGPSRWWLGSVAERVVRSSTVPVLVVRSAPAETPSSAPFLRPLVFGSGEAAASALEYGQLLAHAFSGEVEATEAAACDADRLARASLIVVPTGPDLERSVTEATLLTTCERPILFVPARVAVPAVEQPA